MLSSLMVLLRLTALLTRLCPVPALSQAPYYPGTSQRYQAFRDKYPQAEAIRLGPLDPELEARTAQRLPFLLNVLSSYPGDPQKEYAFQVEPFAPVLTVVRIPGASGAAGAGALGEEEEAVPRFLEAAVRAANEDLWGTLSCTRLVDPRTQEASARGLGAGHRGGRGPGSK